MRRGAGLGAIALLAVAVAAGTTGTSGAAFTSSTTSGVSTVTAASDWTPPLVALTVPDTSVSGVVDLTAEASDGGSSVIVGIDISVSGQTQWTELCAPTSPPLDCAWDTTQWSDGSYDLRAVATDTAGNSIEDVAAGLTVRNTI